MLYYVDAQREAYVNCYESEKITLIIKEKRDYLTNYKKKNKYVRRLKYTVNLFKFKSRRYYSWNLCAGDIELTKLLLVR